MEKWQADLLANIEKRADQGTLRHRADISFYCNRGFQDFLTAASDKHNLNRASYIRRVLSLAISADVGVPLKDVLSLTPRATNIREFGKPVGETDEGANLAGWCPHPGCTVNHNS